MTADTLKNRAPRAHGDDALDTLTDRAYRQLEELIVTLQLAPGQILSEQSLAQDLKFGRTPIREALQRLAREGLVVILPRKGILVSDTNPREQLLVLEARREIERLLSRSGARRRTEDQAASLEAIAQGTDAAAEDNDDIAFMRMDRELNKLVAEAAHNQYASRAMGLLQGLSRRFWYMHYKEAADLLRKQLAEHPRTSEGGFWHKQRYPHQMWLDGLYMGAPFYAQYLKASGADAAAFDDVQRQFDLVMQHHIDPQTGLPYHAWDESREQKWADPETGVSPNFWSRSIGWYVMALVDAIEYFPEDHDGRQVLSVYLQQVLDATLKFRDEQSKLWYQVTDQGDREGNYLEATGSVMFVYAMARGANRGYLPARYKVLAEESYNGLLENLIRIDRDDHEIHLANNCAVAGLGGSPYRDGSYEYYISEPVRDNDPKGIGPFILASLELNK